MAPLEIFAAVTFLALMLGALLLSMVGSCLDHRRQADELAQSLALTLSDSVPHDG